jgi:hypothetical protein
MSGRRLLQQKRYKAGSSSPQLLRDAVNKAACSYGFRLPNLSGVSAVTDEATVIIRTGGIFQFAVEQAKPSQYSIF